MKLLFAILNFSVTLKRNIFIEYEMQNSRIFLLYES